MKSKITSLAVTLVALLAALPVYSQIICSTSETKFVIEIDATTESWLAEVSWSIVDASGTVIDTSAPGTYTTNSIFRDTVCLSNSSSYTFRAYDEYGDGWQGSTYSVYRECDQFVIANNGGIPPTNNAGTVGNVRDLEVSETFTATACPSCPNPVSLNAINITATTADLSWSEIGSATTWDVEYGLSPLTQGAGTLVTGTAFNPLSISSLSSSSDYQFYVRSNCGPGTQSTWAGPFTFTTAFACPPNAVCATYSSGDIASDFGFQTLPGTSTCIGNISVSLPAGQWVNSISTSYDMTAASGAYMSEQVSWLYSPTTSTGEGSVATGSGFSGGTFNYARTGLSFANTALGTVDIEMHAGRTWGGSGCNPSFNKVDVGTWSVIVYYSAAPSCTPPNTLAANNITPTSADLSWLSTGTETLWDIEYDTTGFALGTGTSLTGVGPSPYSLSGLSPLASYDFYVRANCGASGISPWAGPFTFSTLFGISCPTGNQTLVFQEEFDNSTGWTGDLASSPTNGSWVFPHSGGTTSGSTGPFGAHSGSNYMYVETSGNGQPYTANAISPLIDLSAGKNTAALNFHYHAFGATLGTLDVGVSNSPTGPWTSVSTITGQQQATQASPFILQSVNLDAFLGQQIYVRFNYVSGTSFTGDIAIDLMEVYTCITCPPPTNLTSSNITTNSVDINWTSGGAANAEVEWGPTGFSPGTGTQMSATGTSFTITGLSPNITYDIYVKDSCGLGDVSPLLGPETITTPCAGAMSGTYTINPALTTGGTNFNSFVDAAAELNACGISSSVTINISPGLYTERLHLISVPGASASNTITFNGTGADTLVWDQTGPQATVLIDNTPHLTLNGMTIANPVSSEGWGVLITNNSDTVTINNCTVVSDSTSFFSDLSPILVSNSYDNDLSEGADVDGLTVSNSTIIGGFYAMNFEGVNFLTKSVDYTIDNNVIRQFNNAGIFTDEIASIRVTNNRITTDRGIFTGDGVYLSDVNDFIIEGNEIAVGDWGIYVFDGNDNFTPPSRSRIVNNTVISTSDNAIYLNDFEATDVFHNSTSGSPGIAINDQVDVDIRNNIFTSDDDFAFESFDALTATDVVDFNLYYKSGAGDAFDIGPAVYADLAAWQAGDAARNVNSIEGNPSFLAPNNLRVSGQLANNAGTPIASVTVDVDNDLRSATTPDIGADEYTPPSCPNPFALTVGVVTGSTAEFSWTAGFSETLWNIEYGPTGFTQGSGTTANGVTTNPYTITGLSPITTYDVYIQAACAPNDLSTWFGPVAFSTGFRTAEPLICGVALPVTVFSDDFTTNNGWTGMLSSSGNSWEIPGSATSTGTGPNSAHTGPSNSYMNYEATGSWSSTDSASVFSPPIDLTTASLDAELSFWMHAYGNGMGRLSVSVGNSLTGPFTEVFTWSGELQTSDTDPWQNIGVDLTAYTGQTIYLRFTQVYGTNFRGDMSIDQVEVSACVTCPAPTNLSASNITDNSADLSWTAGNTETTWEVEYGLAGFSQGQGTSTGNITANPYTATGLQVATDYEYYVRAVCGAGDSSIWAGPFAFSTTCSTPLTGTYSIDQNQPTTGTNINSFVEAANLLNVCGISGPVTFNIAPGLYTERLHLFSVPGASAANTITFNGTGADTLVWDQTGPQATVLIDNTPHVTLNGMIIANPVSFEGWGVLITNNSDTVTISNCTVVSDSVSTSLDLSPILVSNSYDNDLSEGADVDGLSVINSTIIGGYYAMNFEGVNFTTKSVDYTIDNNVIRQFNNAGIFTDEIASIRVTNNRITTDRGIFTGDGVYLSDVNDFIIEGNEIAVGDWGIYVFDGNDNFTPPSRSRIVNNTVISTSDNAIYLNDFEATDVFHNSTSGSPGIAINDQVDVDIRNNIFTSDDDFAFESFDALTATDVVDFNLYYKSGAGDAFDIGPAVYADLAAWQAGDATRNLFSVEGNPLFNSATDLRVFGPLADGAGTPIASVTVDIDNDPRSATTPDIGADEYDVLSDDAFAQAVFLTDACPQVTDTVRLRVFNGGINTITSLPLTIFVTGDIQDTITNTVAVNIPAFTADTILAGTFSSLAGGNYTVQVITQLVGDQDNANDTAEANGQRFRVVPTLTNVSCNGGNDGSATVTVENPGGLDGSLTTSFASNNGSAGNMFDINVLQPSLELTGFELNLDIGTHTIDFYYKQGTYVGNDANAAAWTYAGNVTVTSSAPDQPVLMSLPNSLNLPNGIHAFFIAANSGAPINYFGGTTEGALQVANADLEIYQGQGRNSNTFTSFAFAPRVFSGSVVYVAGEASYAWSNGDTTATADSLTAGTHTVTATDGNGCITNLTVTITEPTPLTFSKTVSNATCLTNADGFIQISATGGTAPYRYVWNTDTILATDTNNLPVGEYVLTLLDANDCSVSDTTNIVVEDTVDPVLNLQSINVYLNNSGNATIDSSDVDNGSTDECGIATIALSQATFNCSNLGPNTVNVVVTDVNANSDAGNVTVMVIDTVSPTAVAQNLSVFLDANGNASITGADLNNNSSDNCSTVGTGLTFSAAPAAFTCANVGANVVTLTVDDGNGNTSTQNAVVTVIDTVSPTASAQALTVYLDANGNATIAGSDIDAGSSDACGIGALTASPSTFTCANVGVNTVVLTASDPNGNSSTASTSVTVIDTISPALSTQNITVFLDANGNASITVADVDNGSADACGIASISVSPANFNCNTVGPNTVTLTATDDNGNTSAASATVTVIDTVSPVLVLNNHTAYLNAAGNFTLAFADVDNGSSDACGLATIGLSKTSFGCADVGANMVTVTLTDVNGNSASANTMVTLLDTVNPAALAQNITVYLDGNGQALINPNDVDNGSSDACGLLSLDLDTASFNCSDQGPNPVILTVVDVNGNISSASAVVTVVDTISPAITTKNHIAYLDANGIATIEVLDVSSGTSNACSIDTVTVNQTTFTCADIGTNQVTVTASAGGGTASNTANATVTIVDTISPTVVTKTFTAYLGTAGNPLINPSDVDGGSTDNCGIASLSLSKRGFSCAYRGANTVILTVTDINGNSSSAPATVIILDTVVPTAIAKDLTVYLDNSGAASITPAMANMGSTDNCASSAILSLSQSQFTCADEGLNLEYLFFTDASGNVDSASFLITVIDTIAPTMVAKNITVQLGATGQVSIAPSQLDNSSTDNCSNQLFYTASATTFTCANLGTNTITLTGTDVHGNSSSATAIVTVEDNLAPTVNTQAVTLTLNANGQATLTPNMVNNNSGDNCSIANLSLSKSSFTCADLGSNSIALIATDGSGNSASANATVTVVDNVPPSAVAQNITVQLDASGNATINAMMVNNGSTDNCAITNMQVSPFEFDCTNIGANNVFLTVTDANNNSAITMAVVTVEDNVAPTVITRNFAVSLDASGNASITAADVDNGSSDACGITNLTISPSSFTCADLGANNVTLTATDANGNIASANATVTVNDNIAPTVVTASYTAVLNASGLATIVPADIDNGSSDNCSIASYSLDVNSFNCNALGQNAVNLTVTDQSGNAATATAIVSVVDNLAPTVSTQNITVSLNASGQASITPSQVNSGSTDNCAIVNYSLDLSNFTCADIGANTVTLTAVDQSNNSSSATAIVTVVDNIAPTANAQSVTLPLNASGTATLTASSINNGSSDACGISTLSVTPNTFSCADLGTNTVTLTVTDNNNNSSTTTATVTIVDNVAPTVTTQNATVYLNASGQATITVANIDNGSADNCAIATRTLSQTIFTCSNLGQNLVSLTVTDGSGNFAAASASVLVLDTITPTLNNLPTTITAYATAQSCAANVTWPTLTGTDNCAVASIVTTQASGSSFGLGNNSVGVTLTDASGNTRNANFMVMVLDTVAPAFTAVPTNINVIPNTASCDAVVTWSAPSASDNCSGATITTSLPSGATFPVGTTTVTYTATDAAGNSRTGSFIVTVTDVVAPTITNIPANITVANDANACSAVVNYASPTVSDNCTGATLSSTQPTGSTFPVGTTTVIFTATDANGNSTTSSFNVTVEDQEAPVATFVPPSDTVGQCNANYTYSLPTGSDNCTMVNINQISGLPSGAVFPAGPTVNQFEISDAAGNITLVSFTIVVVPQGTPQLPALLEICANANPVPITLGQNIVWSGNGVVNTGTVFNPALAGAGRHILSYVFTDDNGCLVNGTIQVTVTPQPVKPVVTKVASNTLSTSSFNNYQWYRDGVAIPGATSQSYTYTIGGNYQVLVGNSFECTNYSDGFVIGTAGSGIGIDEEIMAGLEVYPNPSTGIVNVDLHIGTDEEVSLVLYSIEGKKVFEHSKAQTSSSGIITLDFGHLPTATYFLHIRSKEQVAVRKIIMN